MKLIVSAAILALSGVASAQESSPPHDDQVLEQAATSPSDALVNAQDAFRNGDFGQLRTVLEPLLYPTPVFLETEQRIEARQLLGVGLFFDAQQVTDADSRRALLDRARHNFYQLLLERPDHVLDPFLYPASVVEVFEAVRNEHLEELQKLLEARAGSSQSAPQTETIYVERQVSTRNGALVFFPFGIGQFQNGEAVKGTLFGVGQALALGLNVTSYLMVENLRGQNGFYDPGPDRRGGDYQDALTWRNVMYTSLGAFVLLWAGSALDAALNFEESHVKIRALDAPPPELAPQDQSGSQSTLPLGWSLQLSF